MNISMDPMLSVVRDGEEITCLFSELELDDIVLTPRGSSITVREPPMTVQDEEGEYVAFFDQANSGWTPEELAS